MSKTLFGLCLIAMLPVFAPVAYAEEGDPTPAELARSLERSGFAIEQAASVWPGVQLYVARR